ncbi:Tetracenomycin polyketide synthesis O-methyltransferase TcmP [Cytospora mali]|uniref:Tetracenomycin polyketide synthesis O-methyltransferase TcmP n=1 Tax=Cytospora mali TaxID=578113 RepID=A0A194W990_CYTMA|nr:Tetracenomycin polyketide synthesis O-methyltransferase TcmP [Valsa mali]
MTKRTIPGKEKVLLSGIEETLLAAIWCRAKDAQSPEPLLGDPYAQQILNRCDVDYTRSTFAALHDERWARFISGRSKKLDDWCQDFLDSQGDKPVQVLQLACGLDSRVLRIRRGPNVRWIDLDKPMVMNLRGRVYAELPIPGEGEYFQRNLSVTEKNWLGDIPQDRPTLVIAEGLMVYLEPAQSKKVTRDIVEYFGLGGQMIFDVLGTVLQRHTSQVQWLKSSGAKFNWGVDDPKEIEELHEKLKVVESQHWYEFMKVERKMSCSPPWFGETATKMASKVFPSFNDFAQVMRINF